VNRSLLRNEDGQAAAEMALILPLLAALLLAIAQFGIAFNSYITLTDATRAGARRAAVSRFVGDNGTSAVLAVRAAAPNLKQTGPDGLVVDATVTNSNWTVPGSEVTVTATYPYSINILGWTIAGGRLTSTTKERLE
jgi:Flp pilus assembly protein TadG